MEMVFITALGVGSATVIGALLGYLIREVPHKYNDVILGFSAGIMLCAAVLGLIVPSLEFGGSHGVLITSAGVIAGAVCLSLIDKLTPHLHRMVGSDIEPHGATANKIGKTMLFVLAIAIHNLPEGIAAGVSFGTGNVSDALTVAAGIALQNIPEGMVIIAPLLLAGLSKGKTFWIAASTGVVEVIGTLFGYFAVTVSEAILPFALAFAGGTMIYVISDEMIPETHAHGNEKSSTYSLIIGFIVMLILDFYIG